MAWRNFKELSVASKEEQKVKRSYSVTSDILSFRICPRQYGMYNHRGYKPAHNIQFWFGLIVHQVVKKLHMHYQGIFDESQVGEIPTEADVRVYFDRVKNNLATIGIRAMNEQESQHAFLIIKEFNRIEGPEFYPKIIETEYTFQNHFEDHILEGVVDVLKSGDTNDPILLEGFDNVEIWDYKAARSPVRKLNASKGSAREREREMRKLQNYRYQMLVYANLYWLKTGRYPRYGRLYFMNELSEAIPDVEKRARALYTIDFTDPVEVACIEEAMEDFGETIAAIERCRECDRWLPPAAEEIADRETCDGCDLRWNCASVTYKPRYP